MNDRQRLLWTSIRRGLMLIVNAIDAYVKEPADQTR